jgi:putative transposase
VVRWAEEAYRVSERRACRAIGVSRSVVRYRSVRPHQAVLRERVKELAAVRVRSGYRQIHVLLRREGWPVNHKRVYRLYTEEGLTLKRRRPKRHRSAAARQQPAAGVAPLSRTGERCSLADRENPPPVDKRLVTPRKATAMGVV